MNDSQAQPTDHETTDSQHRPQRASKSFHLYLIRHGETDYNLRQLVQGHGEVPLNDTGIAQASRLAQRLREMPLHHIYASDLRRATMTAAIIAAFTGVPVTYDAAFRERDPGIHLTDKSYDEALDFFTDVHFAPPGGETAEEFGRRVRAAFNALIGREAGRGRHVAVVTHGMVCAAFLRVCLREPLEQIAATRWPNASLTVAEYDGDWTLRMLGDASHLGGLAGPKQKAPDHVTGA